MAIVAAQTPSRRTSVAGSSVFGKIYLYIFFNNGSMRVYHQPVPIFPPSLSLPRSFPHVSLHHRGGTVQHSLPLSSGPAGGLKG